MSWTKSDKWHYAEQFGVRAPRPFSARVKFLVTSCGASIDYTTQPTEAPTDSDPRCAHCHEAHP